MRRQYPLLQAAEFTSEQSAETGTPSKNPGAHLCQPVCPQLRYLYILRPLQLLPADNYGSGFYLHTASSQPESDGSPAKPSVKLKAGKGTKWRLPSLPIPLVCCWVLLMCLVATYSIYTSTVMWSTHQSAAYPFSEQQTKPPSQNSKDTLIMYIFSPTDPEYERNMQYFVMHGISESHPCHYIIVVQRIEGRPYADLPPLPPNAWYEFHDNVCFDYGTIGWLMRNSKVDTAKYKYFIMMNSSTRGALHASIL